MNLIPCRKSNSGMMAFLKPLPSWIMSLKTGHFLTFNGTTPFTKEPTTVTFIR